MNVRVEKKKNPYAQIDKTPINDRRLSPQSVGVLVYLLSKPDGWKALKSDILKRFHSAEEIKTTINMIEAVFRELRKTGYAKLVPVRDKEKGRVIGSEYVIFETPQEITEVATSSEVGELSEAGTSSDAGTYPTVEDVGGYSNNELLSNNELKEEVKKENAPSPKIESFNYSSETKPFDAEPTIEKSEKRYLEASQKIKNYFAQFPDDMILICDLAKKKLSPARFAEELDKWLSRNVENLTLIQNPVARLKFGESSFKSWIEKPWVSENQEQKNQNNGHARNGNPTPEQRYDANNETVRRIIENDLREAGMLDEFGRVRN